MKENVYLRFVPHDDMKRKWLVSFTARGEGKRREPAALLELAILRESFTY